MGFEPSGSSNDPVHHQNDRFDLGPKDGLSDRLPARTKELIAQAIDRYRQQGLETETDGIDSVYVRTTYGSCVDVLFSVRALDSNFEDDRGANARDLNDVVNDLIDTGLTEVAVKRLSSEAESNTEEAWHNADFYRALILPLLRAGEILAESKSTAKAEHPPYGEDFYLQHRCKNSCVENAKILGSLSLTLLRTVTCFEWEQQPFAETRENADRRRQLIEAEPLWPRVAALLK